MKYLLVLVAFFALYSCGEEEDTQKPQVEFLSPMENDTVAIGGDSLLLSFRVFDDRRLAQLSYVLKDSNDLKYDVGSRFIDGSTYTYSKYVVFGGFAGVQELTLTVTAYDQAYNSSVASRLIYVKP